MTEIQTTAVDSTDSTSNQSEPTLSPSDWPVDGVLFARIWAIGLSVLLIVSYPLWTSSFGVAADFPKVPWFGVPTGGGLVRAMEIAMLVLLIGALGMVIRDGRYRSSWWLIAGALGGLVLMDQHRLQPWAYQSLIYALILGGLPWREGRRWITAVAASIYFFSAAGKLDYQFVHTVGNQMVQTLAGIAGGLSEPAATRLAFALPVGELTIAALIAVPKSRRVGGACAIAMHVTLIALLGPWSLGHSGGVLTWNLLLAAQSWVLFVRVPTADAESKNVSVSSTSARSWIIRVAVVVSLVAPLTERVGYWDHWTSWALYSPHNSRAEIQLHQSAFKGLPNTLSRFTKEDADGDGWVELDIGRWSLDQRFVPIYPQARYQLAFALQFCRQYKIDQAIRVKLKSVSNRWSGTRKETFLIGRSELEREAESYWLIY